MDKKYQIPGSVLKFVVVADKQFEQKVIEMKWATITNDYNMLVFIPVYKLDGDIYYKKYYTDQTLKLSKQIVNEHYEKYLIERLAGL